MKLLSFAVALGAFAMPSWAVVIIADPTLAAGNYSGAQNYLPVGGGAATFSTSDTANGNPNDYRFTNVNFGGGAVAGSQALGEFNLLNIWNPLTQGALNSVSYSIDALFIPGPVTQPNTTAQLLFGLRQGGVNYYNAAFNPLGTSWITATRNGLTQASFGSAFVTGAPQPDFSATGTPIEFGYFTSIFSIPGGGGAQFGVDNFCVVGNGGLSDCAGAFNNGGSADTPEPGTFVLVGGALAGLGIWRRKKMVEVQQ
jgi:PEP-CTERM motif